MVIAHVAGVPVEELIPTLAGAGSTLLPARGWVSSRLRRHRRAGPSAGALALLGSLAATDDDERTSTALWRASRASLSEEDAMRDVEKRRPAPLTR